MEIVPRDDVAPAGKHVGIPTPLHGVLDAVASVAELLAKFHVEFARCQGEALFENFNLALASKARLGRWRLASRGHTWRVAQRLRAAHCFAKCLHILGGRLGKRRSKPLATLFSAGFTHPAPSAARLSRASCFQYIGVLHRSPS